jgi:hypothetical protein
MSDSTRQPPEREVDVLTGLAIKHGTDKWGLHFYTPIYHSLFWRLRKRPMRLLEIGVGGYDLHSVGGASLEMWAEYFPEGQIVGIDVAEKRLHLNPRIEVRQGSQDDPEFLARVCDELGPFDIIIDDGSHVPQQVSTTFGMLFPRLRNRGFYVIEDVQTTFWPRFGGSAADGGATMLLATSILLMLHHADIKVVDPSRQIPEMFKSIRSFHAYHNLFAIEKGDNTEPSNHDYRVDNVHAARALRTIEQEMMRAPTPAGCANLIQLYAVAGDRTNARIWLTESLAKWPHHPALLYAAYNVAVISGDTALKLEYVRKLAAIEPDNGALRALLQRTESEAGTTWAADP